jgi:anti-anti-sigma regulatory factor
MIVEARKVCAGVVMLNIEGEIFSIETSSAMLRGIVSERAEKGEHLLINLKEATCEDAEETLKLLNLLMRVRQTRLGNTVVKFLCVPQSARDILEVTGLANQFEMFEDENEAIRSFS